MSKLYSIALPVSWRLWAKGAPSSLAAKDALPATAHAALGISAHINYDLALGIHQVVVELGAQHDHAACPATAVRCRSPIDTLTVSLPQKDGY